MLAGVSPEWYTWLEQGRDIRASDQVLESLSRTLRLDHNEREHLFFLAQQRPPLAQPYALPTISPKVRQFIDQLGALPTAVFDTRMNIVGWNTACRVLMGQHGQPIEQEPNAMRRLFLDPAQQRGAEWREFARLYVAQLRAEYGRFADDPWWAEQIAILQRASPEFRELWDRHDVLRMPEGQKRFHNARVGEMTFDFVVMETAYAADLRVMIYTPRRGTGSAERFDRLLAIDAGFA